MNLGAVAAALLVGIASASAGHDKDCKGKHGTVSARSDESITVNGKSYTMDANTTVMRHDGSTAAPTGIKVGDSVCVKTASDDSKQVSAVMVMEPGSKMASADRVRVHDKLSEVERKAHEKMCQGKHGTITDKTANSLTIDGKQYAFKINTPVNKQEEPLYSKITKVGDRVCFTTMEAADGTHQIAKLMAIDEQADRVRVREKESDVKVESKPGKVEIETPEHEVEVK